MPKNQVIAVNQRPDRTARIAPENVPMKSRGRIMVKAKSNHIAWRKSRLIPRILDKSQTLPTAVRKERMIISILLRLLLFWHIARLV